MMGKALGMNLEDGSQGESVESGWLSKVNKISEMTLDSQTRKWLVTFARLFQ